MAIWPRKKGDGSADGFKPDPEKARTWFDHAAKAASGSNHAAAIHYYASGIRFDPETMSAHEKMLEAARAYMASGGSPATSKELKQFDGAGAVDKLAAAEFAWMKDLSNPSLAMKFIESAVEAGQGELVRYHATRIVNLLMKQKKPSKGTLLSAMERLAEAGAWNEAIAAGEAALRLDPNDSKLAAHMKDLLAQRTMDQAGYAEAAGAEGGFRKFVKDDEKQRELVERESLAASASTEERNLDRAKRDLDANPLSTDAINRYAQLLKRRATPEAEEEAFQIYMRGFEATKEYRFRMAAGDVRIEQAARALARLSEEMQTNPSDASLPARIEKARRELQNLRMAEYTARVDQYPTDRRLKVQLGETLVDDGRFGEAMAQFQAAKDEPRLRFRAGWLLGRCFAAEGWHSEAIQEYREALTKLDATERELENQVRYDLMESLIAQAREERSVELAREALGICSDIARKDITFRDIRSRRNEIGQLIKELGG